MTTDPAIISTSNVAMLSNHPKQTLPATRSIRTFHRWPPFTIHRRIKWRSIQTIKHISAGKMTQTHRQSQPSESHCSVSMAIWYIQCDVIIFRFVYSDAIDWGFTGRTDKNVSTVMLQSLHGQIELAVVSAPTLRIEKPWKENQSLATRVVGAD